MNDFREEPTVSSTFGSVYWITGLPGVGKRTLARTLAVHIRRQGRQVLEFDEGRLLNVLGGGVGRIADHRAASNIYARLCNDIASNGHDVVIATVSMFHEVQKWNRQKIDHYYEIYLRSSTDTISTLHPKGLIAAGLARRIRNVPGVDLPIEEPVAPDILVDVDARKSAAAVAEEVIYRLVRLDHSPSSSSRLGSAAYR